MRKHRWSIGAAAIFLASASWSAFSWGKAQPPQTQQVPQTSASAPTKEAIPAYHAARPTGVLPATLPAQDFTDPLTKKAYSYAARIKPALYQLPCYCRCDQAVGHTSLLSCYRDQHGSECETCKKELFYAYEQSHRGKTPPQIRAGIIHGDWKKVDLAKYAPPLSSGSAAKN